MLEYFLHPLSLIIIFNLCSLRNTHEWAEKHFQQYWEELAKTSPPCLAGREEEVEEEEEGISGWSDLSSSLEESSYHSAQSLPWSQPSTLAPLPPTSLPLPPSYGQNTNRNNFSPTRGKIAVIFTDTIIWKGIHIPNGGFYNSIFFFCLLSCFTYH